MTKLGRKMLCTFDNSECLRPPTESQCTDCKKDQDGNLYVSFCSKVPKCAQCQLMSDLQEKLDSGQL